MRKAGPKKAHPTAAILRQSRPQFNTAARSGKNFIVQAFFRVMAKSASGEELYFPNNLLGSRK
ncbi:MAG: hypothetical protein JO360_13310 [Acidobacteria bacterium]|nr:hypothetical protein [Acidobacteriota bacterium]